LATRPVFSVAGRAQGLVRTEQVDFQWFPGFSLTQKQKSIQSLHQAYQELHPTARILEVSTKSPERLGVALSAFALKLPVAGRQLPVENIFQAGKVFAGGGPFTDLLDVPPHVAKRDPRLKNSGPLKCFTWQGQVFPLEPKTLFYDWIYLTALAANPALSRQLLAYDAFTDIEFNPERSINCQARSCALFAALSRAGILREALSSLEAFTRVLEEAASPKQATLFDS